MKFIFSFVLLVFVLFSCSTEKDTFVNKAYHGTTAKYNGYFNANELINTSLVAYQKGRKEDFYQILPIAPYPNETEVKGMLPALDTAIVKCAKVIGKHAMPTASEPSKKRAEYNPWIDENWLTIGKAYFYKKEYDKAFNNFKYINKFFSNDPSNYDAAVWMLKTHLELNAKNEANLLINDLDKKIEELDRLKEEKKKNRFKNLFSKKKKKKKRSKFSKKKKTEDEEPAEFRKNTRFEFELTKASFYLKEKENDKAIEALEKAVKYTRKSYKKARIYYILAQLYAGKSDQATAYTYYSKVLKKNAAFDMAFNARINRAMMSGGEKVKHELNKMLRDAKNAEYKDQIYFALAEIEIKNGKKDKGIELLHKSVIVSISNNLQKAICYERLGDFAYQDKKYINAQKYYDSCVKVLPQEHEKYPIIANKATKLKDLVEAVETAQYEDSIQKIAGLSPEEQLAFAEKVVKDIQDKEKKRKEAEAAKLKLLQEQQALNQNTRSGTKFFWNNPKVKSEEIEIFRKNWGARENEDDWRRSEKIPAMANNLIAIDSAGNPQGIQEVKDTLSLESLLANIPVGDSAIQVSQDKMLNALYTAGIIYKDQLKETKPAISYFEKLLAYQLKSKYNVMSLYQLYGIYEKNDPPKAYEYKNQILVTYPESDYAYYLADPDYFIKKKEYDKLAESDFTTMLERYNKGMYAFVMSSSKQVIEDEPKNAYRSKYLLLYGMSVAQTSSNKRLAISPLKQVGEEFPNSDEAKRANELINLIEKGYSKFSLTSFENKSIYKYDNVAKNTIVVFLEPKQNVDLAKSRIADLNKDIAKKQRLNVSSLIFDIDKNVILIKELDLDDAKEYIREFKKSKKLMGVEDSKIFHITNDNFKTLYETKKIQEYEDFMIEFY